MSDRLLRIANGQGFWSDSPDAPVRLVEGGPLDYQTLHYLAEVTMSILQKQKRRDPSRGYATDFVDLVRRILPAVRERGIKVAANAGGVNPDALWVRLSGAGCTYDDKSTEFLGVDSCHGSIAPPPNVGHAGALAPDGELLR